MLKACSCTDTCLLSVDRKVVGYLSAECGLSSFSATDWHFCNLLNSETASWSTLLFQSHCFTCLLYVFHYVSMKCQVLICTLCSKAYSLLFGICLGFEIELSSNMNHVIAVTWMYHRRLKLLWRELSTCWRRVGESGREQHKYLDGRPYSEANSVQIVVDNFSDSYVISLSNCSWLWGWAGIYQHDYDNLYVLILFDLCIKAVCLYRQWTSRRCKMPQTRYMLLLIRYSLVLLFISN